MRGLGGCLRARGGGGSGEGALAAVGGSVGGAESAQSPGSHTLNWSHGDLAFVRATVFLGDLH